MNKQYAKWAGVLCTWCEIYPDLAGTVVVIIGRMLCCSPRSAEYKQAGVEAKNTIETLERRYAATRAMREKRYAAVKKAEAK